MTTYKPKGYNSVSPYLIVDDAKAALGFIKAVFGNDPSFIRRCADGEIVHAEVLIDDTIVMLGQSPGGPDINVHVYVADIDASLSKALAAGGVAVQEPMEKGDGDRRGGVADPTGTTWWLSTQITER